jgi:hypothetical protein
VLRRGQGSPCWIWNENTPFRLTHFGRQPNRITRSRPRRERAAAAVSQAERLRGFQIYDHSNFVDRSTGKFPEAVRLCLGGPITRPRLAAGLEYMAHALTEGPALA